MAITKVTNRVLDDSSVGVAQLSSLAVPTKLTSEIGALNFRNKIINGGMEIDQRNTGAAVTTGSGYTVDRWFGSTNPFVPLVFQRVAVATGLAQYISFALRMNGAAGNERCSINQRIESNNSRSLIGRPIVVSFFSRTNSPTPITLTVGLEHPNTQDNYTTATIIANPTVSVTSTTLTRYTLSFNSMPNEVSNGLHLRFIVHNSELPAGRWIDITGVQLEEGSVATPFEQRPIGLELSLCQRYYETGRIYVGFAIEPDGTSGDFSQAIHFNTSKRTTTPTVSSNFIPGTGDYSTTYFTSWFSLHAGGASFTIANGSGSDCGGTVNWTASNEL